MTVKNLLLSASFLVFLLSFPLGSSAGAQEAPAAGLREIGSFAAYDGGIIVESRRVRVFEQLDRVHDEQAGKDVFQPDEDEAKTWRGEEFRELDYAWAGTKFELKSKRFVRSSEVPFTALDTRSCDTLNRLSLKTDSDLLSALPKGVLVKAVLPVRTGSSELVIVAYSTPSPSDSTSDYESYLALVDPHSRKVISVTESEQYVDFCALKASDVVGDRTPEIVLYGLSLGGSGLSKTVQMFEMTGDR